VDARRGLEELRRSAASFGAATGTAAAAVASGLAAGTALVIAAAVAVGRSVELKRGCWLSQRCRSFANASGITAVNAVATCYSGCTT